MKLYQQLKRIRERKGIAQAKIAELAGMTQATVSAFERGSAQTIRNLIGYAAAVNARVELPLCVVEDLSPPEPEAETAPSPTVETVPEENELTTNPPVEFDEDWD